MNIVAKMQEKEARFNGLRDQAVQLNNEIKSIQEQANAEIQARQKGIQELNDEMNRVQGEHRLLVELGKEQGILDESGNAIAPPQEEAEPTA